MVCVMILGLQCLDPRPVWLLMGHDGTFLEHSTCAGQSSGSSIWRGHLHQTYGKSYISFVEYLLSVTGITNRISQDYCCTLFPFSNPSPNALSFLFMISCCVGCAFSLERHLTLTVLLSVQMYLNGSWRIVGVV